MLDRPQDDPAGRVAALVRGFLAKRSIDPSVGHDDDLAASALSSLDIVNLMLAVEAEFDLKISRPRDDTVELSFDRAHCEAGARPDVVAPLTAVSQRREEEQDRCCGDRSPAWRRDSG